MAPPVFDANVHPSRIDELLSRSHCRNCGKCCLLNPLNPSYPGVEIAEDELKEIVKLYRIFHKDVRNGTKKGGQINALPFPFQVINTKWLILPCMFYDLKKEQCRVHELRPIVCKIFPLIFHFIQETWSSGPGQSSKVLLFELSFAVEGCWLDKYSLFRR